MTDVTEPVFEDSAEMPSGRKARVVSKALWAALEDSAKRSIAKGITGAADVVDELKKDLGSAAVRAKYDVTTGSAAVDGGKVRLTFSAVKKIIHHQAAAK